MPKAAKNIASSPTGPEKAKGTGNQSATGTAWRSVLKQQVRVDASHWPELTGQPDYDPGAEKLFALRAPAHFLRSAHPALMRQILPSRQELLDRSGTVDPVGDTESTVAPGVIHKYAGRVLLIANGLCAINCRYCFRRHFPYAQQYASHNNWRDAVNYLKTHRDVHEVILSGGDPLTLSTERLQSLTRQLQVLPHIDSLRIHSRVPVVLPQRITGNLLAWLNDLRLKKILVIHTNHAEELTGEHRKIFRQLQKAGVTLLNQSVLLKGINDTSDALIKLSRRLFDCGVLPYYLHQLDRVAGAGHFAVDHRTACQLRDAMQAALPGYLVPRLVQEIPQSPSKTLLF